MAASFLVFFFEIALSAALFDCFVQLLCRQKFLHARVPMVSTVGSELLQIWKQFRVLVKVLCAPQIASEHNFPVNELCPLALSGTASFGVHAAVVRFPSELEFSVYLAKFFLSPDLVRLYHRLVQAEIRKIFVEFKTLRLMRTTTRFFDLLDSTQIISLLEEARRLHLSLGLRVRVRTFYIAQFQTLMSPSSERFHRYLLDSVSLFSMRLHYAAARCYRCHCLWILAQGFLAVLAH
jgi:hypothetical protein